VLDPALKAFEQAAVTAVQASMAALFSAGAIDRRGDLYEPPQTPWYSWDVTVVPAESTGHPLGSMEVVALVTFRTYGRDTAASKVVIDKVRFMSEMAIERVMASKDFLRLFDRPESMTYEHDVVIDGGPFVFQETVSCRVKMRDTLAAGIAEGIAAQHLATWSASPTGTARAALASPVVHHQGLDQIVLTAADEGDQVANVVALWAGAVGDESETLELVPYAGGAALDTFTLAAAAGSHTFAGVAAGTYLLRIVDGSGTRSESLPVRVLEAP
jgi:hypothetical protein